MKGLRILIAEPQDFSPRAATILRQAGEVDLRATPSAELPRAFADYDVVWIRLAGQITADVIGSAPRCRLLAVPTTGLDHVDLEACRRKGVQVVSLQGEVDFLRNIRATAELTLALTLAMLRRLPEAIADAAAGRWNRDAFRGREVFGKTIGVVGVGRLGSIVAEYFRALGADVVGYDPRPDFPVATARRIERLADLLAASDVVCLLVKYDAGTRHLIGAREFAAMKPGAAFVNVSRGGVVDESALIAALESGRLAGAALDVLQGEPYVTADHPVVRYARNHPNVLLTPHIGGNTFESFEKTEVFLAEKVVAALGNIE